MLCMSKYSDFFIFQILSYVISHNFLNISGLIYLSPWDLIVFITHHRIDCDLHIQYFNLTVIIYACEPTKRVFG